MRRLISSILAIATCVLTVGVLSLSAQQPQRPRRLTKLQKLETIYVGDMGPSEEAEQFRLMLEEQLLKRDFEVVLDPKDADAVLTGILIVQDFDYNSDASVTVRLISKTGGVAWAKDFSRKGITLNPFARPETTRSRAEQVAEAIKREFKKPKGKQP